MTDKHAWQTPELTELSVSLDTAVGTGSQSDGQTGTGKTPG